MPLYENVFLARQDVPAQEVESIAETFAGIITEQGGAVSRREYWGLRNLAYRIKKNRKAHYTMLHIDAPASAVHEMERNMRINEDVLRYLTIRVEEFEEGTSIMMQSRAAREDRPRRDGGRRDGGGRRDERKVEASGAKADNEKADDKKTDDKKAEATDTKADDKKADDKRAEATDTKADDKKSEAADATADDAKPDDKKAEAADASTKDDDKAETKSAAAGEDTADKSAETATEESGD